MKIDYKSGTLNSDTLSSSGNSLIYGLNGDDVLSSQDYSSSTLAGGSGHDVYYTDYRSQTTMIDTGWSRNSNDIYNLGQRSYSTISDNGGIDQINAKYFALHDPATYVATVRNGTDLIMQNYKEDSQIIIINWQSPFYSIEKLSFADGTYTKESFTKAIRKNPLHVGDITSEFVKNENLREAASPFFWSKFQNNILSFEENEINEIKKNNSITTQKTKLSIIVSPGIIDKKAVFLKDLNEILTYQKGNLISHTIEYAGITFNYTDIDSVITTVTRDNQFTREFAQEVADFDSGAAGVSYQTAVQLIGQVHINDTLLFVAGADGSYIS